VAGKYYGGFSNHMIIWSTIPRIIYIRVRFLYWWRVSVRFLVLRRYRTRWRIIGRVIRRILLASWRWREIVGFREIASRWICSSGISSYGYIRRWSEALVGEIGFFCMTLTFLFCSLAFSSLRSFVGSQTSHTRYGGSFSYLSSTTLTPAAA